MAKLLRCFGMDAAGDRVWIGLLDEYALVGGDECFGDGFELFDRGLWVCAFAVPGAGSVVLCDADDDDVAGGGDNVAAIFDFLEFGVDGFALADLGADILCGGVQCVLAPSVFWDDPHGT